MGGRYIFAVCSRSVLAGKGRAVVDAWDEFLLLVYGLPPAIIVGAALVAKLAAGLMRKPLGWGRAFAIGVAALVIGFAGMLIHWLSKG